MAAMGREPGILVISLDFELYWGVRDKLSVKAYEQHLLGARKAIPTMLQLFQEYGVHATWATVGFLFFSSREELLAGIPDRLPQYRQENLSPYTYLERGSVGEDERVDPFHYAPSLIRQIMATPGQRIGTHTFSHFYCLEEGQDLQSFTADLQAAQKAAKPFPLELQSIVFPRNQVVQSYLPACAEAGIVTYRGTESSWVYQASGEQDESWLKRGIRLLDAYVNLTGQHCYKREQLGSQPPYNVPASRFLRPYSPRLKKWEPLRLKRITRALRQAAEQGEIYHLWWHPHNFGVHLQENIQFLRSVLDVFANLREQYGMVSMNMEEVAASVMEKSRLR